MTDTIVSHDSPSSGMPPWRSALNELARLAGLSAVMFAALYVLGLIRLVGFLWSLGVPYQVVRQDPVSIASSVLQLVVPTLAVWLVWRTFHSQYKSLMETFRRQWVVLLLLVGIPVGLVITTLLRGEWSFAITYGLIALLYAYLGAPDALLEGRRPFVVGVALVIAAAVLGNADAGTVRDRAPATMSIRVSAEQPGLSGRTVEEGRSWDYEGLVFVYQDLDRLYLLQDPGRGRVVMVPLGLVRSISFEPSRVTIRGQ